MEKIVGTSLDLEQKNIDLIKKMFPNVVSEGKIDFDMLRTILGDEVDSSNEKYQFTWKGKNESVKISQSPSAATLLPCKDISKNWDSTENIYIEGDNLEVLKLLQKTYFNKIKMIYIDPPYNTGKQFIYKDNYKDSISNYLFQTKQEQKSNPETSGRYHTDWLNMMYPRLVLARNLLTDDGVIFISIDDNEVENLKKLCSEIFGHENFVAMLSVENNPKGRKNSDFISVSSEYCVIYAKNKNKSYFVENVPKKASDMTLDENGRYVHNSGKRVLVGENSFNDVVTDVESDKNYAVYYRRSDSSIRIVKEEFGFEDASLISQGYIHYHSYNNGENVENTYTEEHFLELYEQGALEFSEDKIYEKNYSDTIRMKSQLVNREYEAIVNGERKNFSFELTTTGAGTYLKELFNLSEVPFPSPKNTGFLKMLITLFDDKDFIALDFFGGSSSFADAILQQNYLDGGRRKFILVQFPEKCKETDVAFKAGFENICLLGEERIRLCGEKLINSCEPMLVLSEESNISCDIGFKVFRLDTTNINPWDNVNEYDEKTIFDTATIFKTDRSKEDVLYEIMLKYGVFNYAVSEVSINDKALYRVGQRHMIVCLEDKVDDKDVEEICKLKPKVVIFNEAGFKDDNAKINAEYNLKEAGVEYVKCI